VRDADGEPARFFGINQDITERKRAEAALRETHEQLLQARKLTSPGE
ncbi:MAG: XRE family transcriptional regulator, partial [Lentisphaerae bacterium]|nr:XRE family transcriptional regulator [Lentisphaerota bacterium]